MSNQVIYHPIKTTSLNIYKKIKKKLWFDKQQKKLWLDKRLHFFFFFELYVTMTSLRVCIKDKN